MTNHTLLKLGIATAITFSASFAQALTINSGFSPTDIPDEDATGITLSIGSTSEPVTLNSVGVDFHHTFAGDLTFTVNTPSGSFGLFDIFNDDDTLGPDFGVEGTDPFQSALYTFVESGGQDLVSALDALDDSFEDVALDPTPSYNSREWIGGVIAPGEWTITTTDSFPGDTGVISAVSLDVTAIPEPSSVSLLFLGAIALQFSRFRRCFR